MSKKLSSLTRKIAVSALSAVYAHYGSANELKISNLMSANEIDTQKMEVLSVRNQNLDLKLRLKPSAYPDKWEYFAHRSHRSHSSHSSHRSHYSSRTSPTYTPSGGGRSSTFGSETTVFPNNSSTLGTNGTSTFSLGTRLLKLGMQGEDVADLIKLLVEKGYYNLPDGQTLNKNELFDLIVEEAVKKFQKDQGITVDGIVGPTTLYYLKYK